MTRTTRPPLTIAALAAGATAATLLSVNFLSHLEGPTGVPVALDTLPTDKVVITASRFDDALPAGRIVITAHRLGLAGASARSTDALPTDRIVVSAPRLAKEESARLVQSPPEGKREGLL
jgi:hypothetical protein